MGSRDNKTFKVDLSFVKWKYLNDIKGLNSAYKEFLFLFSDIYNSHFQIENVTVKLKVFEEEKNFTLLKTLLKEK